MLMTYKIFGGAEARDYTYLFRCHALIFSSLINGYCKVYICLRSTPLPGQITTKPSYPHTYMWRVNNFLLQIPKSLQTNNWKISLLSTQAQCLTWWSCGIPTKHNFFFYSIRLKTQEIEDVSA